MRLVCLACGNPSRGDDALGPFLLDHLAELRSRRPDPEDVLLVEDFQFQVEHALDLHGRELALFIDASVSCRRPYAFERVWARRDPSYTSHAMTPGAVLHAYREVYGESAPPSFVLSVRGGAFGLGEPLSLEARAHLGAARAFLDRLLSRPAAPAWDALTEDAPLQACR